MVNKLSQWRLRIWSSRLGWKLMTSYLIVIMVGVLTLAMAAESVVPSTFNRHVTEMAQMMNGGQTAGSTLTQMETDLFTNYRAAFSEALTLAAIAAFVSAVVVSFLVSQRVVTPIQQLMEASRRIATGNYGDRVAAGDDELGELGRSFNQMAEALNRTETMRRDLIANVTHELRTPLTSITGYMEGLMDGVLPADADTFQQVHREADRLQRLVNDLQELSRVEANAIELRRQLLPAEKVIRQTADRLRPQFDDKGVALTLELPEGMPPVPADEDRLSQILVNLMGNALQYTPAGGSVAVSVARTGNFVRVTITDTGIGIPVEHLPHLFTRFYRVDKSRSRAGGGSGIGLTIARHLVEAHGGEISARSAGRGKGSTFGFSLPLHLG